MNIHKDIFATIAQYLCSDPIDIICLTRVNSQAYMAIAPLFPLMLRNNADITIVCESRRSRIIPYKKINPMYSGLGRDYHYKLTWGSLHISMYIYTRHVLVYLCINLHVVSEFYISQFPYQLVERLSTKREITLAAARFVAGIFPGAYIVQN